MDFYPELRLETQIRCYNTSKAGSSVAHKKNLCVPNENRKKEATINVNSTITFFLDLALFGTSIYDGCIQNKFYGSRR